MKKLLVALLQRKETLQRWEKKKKKNISGCVDKGCMCVPHGPDVDQGKDSPPGVTLEAMEGNHPEG